MKDWLTSDEMYAMKEFLRVLASFLIGVVVMCFIVAPASIWLGRHVLFPYWDWVAKL